MRHKICLWGLLAFILGVLGLLLASSVGVRLVTVTLAALGVLAALAGIPATRGGRDRKDVVWLSAGGLLSAAVLGVALFVPGLLNDFWAIDFAVPDTDPNLLVRVPREQSRDEGHAVAESDWVDAEKEGIRQDDVFIRLEWTKIGPLPEKGKDLFLLVNLRVTQIAMQREITFLGLNEPQYRPALADDAGRKIAYLGNRPRLPFRTVFDTALNVDYLLIFELPSPATRSLKLEVPTAAWGRHGTCRFQIDNIQKETDADMAKVIAQYKKMLRAPPEQPPDAAFGRAVFAKNCQECHSIFGFGAKIGPELTDRGLLPNGKPKRTDIDFILTSILDPSAEIAKDYLPSVVIMQSGLVVHGIIKEKTADTLTMATVAKIITLPTRDVEEIKDSKVSLMPLDLLKPMNEHEVRSLLAYLMGPRQAPILATLGNSFVFFNNQNLNYWHSASPAWKVEAGEIVTPAFSATAPKTSPRDALLVSELLAAADFGILVHFHAGKDSKGALLIGAEEPLNRLAAGPRVELTGGGKIALYAANGSKPVLGAATILADTWHKLEITVSGDRLSTRLNGKEDAAIDNAGMPPRRVVALEGPGSAGQELRFRNLDLRLLNDKQ